MSISFGFSRGELIVRKVRLAHATVPVRADMALDTGLTGAQRRAIFLGRWR